MRAVVLLAAGAVLLSGCVARTAWNVATLPVKAASKTVDVLTTSQDEADRNLGRKVRKEEERRGREARKDRDDD